MRKHVAVFWIALVITAVGCINSEAPSGPVVGVPAEQSFGETYSLGEVAKHNSSGDCWLVLHGKVYNVTGFIASGKHGPAINQGCGKDATELYETRPMGSGTPHSQRARDIMEEYHIGELQG